MTKLYSEFYIRLQFSRQQSISPFKKHFQERKNTTKKRTKNFKVCNSTYAKVKFPSSFIRFKEIETAEVPSFSSEYKFPKQLMSNLFQQVSPAGRRKFREYPRKQQTIYQ